MYSNEKKGFSLLDLIVKIIFAGLFIFILVWLFQKKVPNMAPFYSNVFRENIKYMQEAGESYFTDDKMPKEVGEESKITLAEMYDKKLLIPFVDEDGNSCNQYDSYVSLIKTELGYELKTNLVCNTESDYTVKILGCHNYCKDNACTKKCAVEQIVQYQYKKAVKNTKEEFYCESGYTLDGKNCKKTVLSDSKPATITNQTTRELTEDATPVVTGKKCDSVAKNTTKSYTDKLTTKSYTNKLTDKSYTDNVLTKTYKDAIKTVTPSTTREEQVAYTCQKTKRECHTTYQSYSYSCNCTGYWSHGQYYSSCSTCSGTTPVETCENVPYNDTCYKTETITVPGTTTYDCPAGYTKEGSGSTLKCYKNVYSCPAGYSEEGSGSTLKCYKNNYSCPTGYSEEGSGSTLKCYKNNYNCPTGYTKEGSGSSLKCYKNVDSCPSGYAFDETKSSKLCYKCTDGTVTYKCADATWKLEGKVCKKTITEGEEGAYCPDGYKLEGTTCNKYSTDSKSAKSKKKTTTSYKYQWSEKTSISGWTKTGKTRTVNGKEVCE